jgi:hypothetical protein
MHKCRWLNGGIDIDESKIFNPNGILHLGGISERWLHGVAFVGGVY